MMMDVCDGDGGGDVVKCFDVIWMLFGFVMCEFWLKYMLFMG